MEDIGGGDVGQNLKKEGRQYGEVRGGGGLHNIASLQTLCQLRCSYT